jgi:hypothetical protein
MPMRNIAELNILVRVRVELPTGTELATEEFREGWNFVRSADARRLEKIIQTRGWNFIKIAKETLRSGVGESSQEAIGNALKLTLRRVSDSFNAVEVEHIELTQYPWFFLARVCVCPYRIQQGTVLPVLDEAMPLPSASRHRRLPVDSPEMYPHFGSAIPMLKEMLISTGTSQARPQ